MKKFISFTIMFIMTFSFITGCKKEAEDTLVYEGKEIVIKIGEDKYISADEVFSNLLVNKNNMQYIYEKIREVVIKTAAPADSTMNNNVLSRFNKWENEAKETARVSNISLKEAKLLSLAKEGVKTEEELKEKWLFELQSQKVTDRYWRESKSEYYEDYYANNLPFHISEIKVSLTSSGSLDSVYKTISEDEAKKISAIAHKLINGEKFYQVAEVYNSSSENRGGDIGLVSLTSDVEKEVKVALLAYAKYFQNADLGFEIDDFINEFYLDGFEAIPLNFVKELEKQASSYNWVVESNNRPEGVNTSNLYPRNVVFNNIFNTSTFRFLVNEEVEEETLFPLYYNKHEVKLPVETSGVFQGAGEQEVLYNASNHPILVVRSSSALHFISINKSPFDEDAQKYYEADPSLDDDYTSFIESGYPKVVAEERKEALNEFAREYATLGLYKSENEKYIDYDMVKKYMSEYNIQIIDERLDTLFNLFLNEKINYQKFKFINNVSTEIKRLSSKIELRNSSLLQKELIPLVCIKETSNCRYTYTDGYFYTPSGGGEG